MSVLGVQATVRLTVRLMFSFFRQLSHYIRTFTIINIIIIINRSQIYCTYVPVFLQLTVTVIETENVKQLTYRKMAVTENV